MFEMYMDVSRCVSVFTPTSAAATVTPQMIDSLKQLFGRVQQLRNDCQSIRQQQVNHIQTTRDAINTAYNNIKVTLNVYIVQEYTYPVHVSPLSALLFFLRMADIHRRFVTRRDD